MRGNGKVMIELERVSKSYEQGGVGTIVLRHISLQIHPGEKVAIVGPSGSGKSSLLQILGLLDTHWTGCYKLDGRLVKLLSHEQMAWQRNHTIGFVFQFFYLLEKMTALQNVYLPLRYASSLSTTQHIQKAKSLLEKMQIAELADQKPTQLSGGQQQRVAIARALINEPSLILADEPTGALDSQTGQLILSQLLESDATVVLVTHDKQVADACSRVLYLVDGQFVDAY